MANSVDFVVKNGIVVSSTAVVQSSVESTSTNTGALVVAGGVGIGKNLNIGGNTYLGGGLYVQGVEIVPANMSTTTGAISVLGGTGINGIVYTSNITIASDNSSISTNTGALTVAGGVGIGKDLYIGGNTHLRGTLYVDGLIVLTGSGEKISISGTTSTTGGFIGGTTFSDVNIASTTPSESVTSGALTVAGGAGIVGNLNASEVYDSGNRVLTSIIAGTGTNVSIIGTTATISLAESDDQPLNVTNTTSSTSTASGALTVMGGVGIGQDLFVGGNIIVEGLVIVNGTGTFTSSNVMSYSNNTIDGGSAFTVYEN